MGNSVLRKIGLIPAWISEFFHFCPLQRRSKPEDEVFLIIGHRGSPAHEIENTIPSFERAIREGANAIELDLSITSDGVVIIWHDWDPNDTVAVLRESGFEPHVKYKPHPPSIGSQYRKRVSKMTFEQFNENFDYKIRHGDTQEPAGAKVPTLTEFFTWAVEQGNLLYVFFDVKSPPDESEYSHTVLVKIKEHIEEFKPQFKAIIETTHLSVLNTMKNTIDYFDYSIDIEPPFGIILDPSEYSAVQAAINNKNTYALALRPRKITVANWTTFRRIIRYDVKLRKAFNKKNPGKPVSKLICATISKTNELRCLVKMGVNGIQTDFPDKLRRIAVKNGKVIHPEQKSKEYSSG